MQHEDAVIHKTYRDISAEDNSRTYSNKPVQQEENAPAYGSDVAENVARMANGGNREAWIVSNKALNRTSESKNTS